MAWPFKASQTRTADRLIAEGNRLEESGELQRASERYRDAVHAAPAYARAQLNLGIALEALGESAGATQAYRKALELDPHDAFAAYNLGKLRYGEGALEEAAGLIAQALQARADFPQARFVGACIALERGEAAAAAPALAEAAAARPDDFGAQLYHARALRALARHDEAVAALQRALRIDPASADAYAELAEAHGARGDTAAAAEALRALTALRPDWADALYNYGALLKKMMRLDEAQSVLRRALEADPAHARAYRMLGSLLLAHGRADEALALYREGRARLPDDFRLESAELFALSITEGTSEEELLERHRQFGRRLERAAGDPPALHVRREADRPLRIGYLSGDFGFHVVTLFMLPVLERHDRQGFEIACYSTGEATDQFARRVQAAAKLWRPAAGWSEAQLAEAIRADGIDILVDLAGHSGVPNLGVMARRPAPVQATWLGYLATTGLSRIDYKLSDGVVDAPGSTERYHTEEIVRLPDSLWCYRPFIPVEPSPSPPAARQPHVTFGSFNQTMKLSPSTRALWRELLRRVPDSKLLLVGVPPAAHEALRRDLGAEPARVEIVPYVALPDYYRRLDAVDIALDTAPYSGATTTCDALWMGVPVITLPGPRPVSRSAASLLHAVRLDEWVAQSPQAYLELAAGLAADRPQLAALKRGLRERMRASPLMDEAGFTRNLEAAYREMWRRGSRAA